MLINNIRLYFEELENKPKYDVKDWIVICLLCITFALIASLESIG